MSNQTFTLIDMFAGAGGLSCGLQLSGFRSILASDINPSYSQTFKYNHPKTIFLDDDIKKISGAWILKLAGLKKGELDLLAGGPPCQGFSVNAPIRSLDDQRNHLFKDYLRIASELSPKIILIENVPGIVSFGKGTVVRAIYDELNKMGYKVNHRILFAGHYGVPQLRFRTIFIATRLNTDIKFPEPTHFANGRANFGGAKELCIKLDPESSSRLKKRVSAWDAISDLPEIKPGERVINLKYKVSPSNEFQTIATKDSDEVFNHNSAKLSKINLDRLKHIPQGGSWRNIPFDLLPAGLKKARRSDHTKRYGRLHPDELCSTIMTKCDPHWGSFFHPNQNRALSVREAARIQSFPDNFIFIGSLTQQYEQIGNAVPPLLAKAIGCSIAEMLKNS